MKLAGITVVFVTVLTSLVGCSGTSSVKNDKQVSIKTSQQVRYNVLTNLASALASTGKPARVYFHGVCDFSNGGDLLFPDIEIHIPLKDQKGIQAVRYMFSDDSGVVVSEEPSGIVRVKIGNVSTEILNTRVRSLLLSQVAQYNPNVPDGAIDTIEDTAEVKTAMANLKIRQVPVPMNVFLQPPDETSPHLPGKIRNATVEQLLDSIAQTFRGIVVYGECRQSNGEGLIDIEFNWIPSGKGDATLFNVDRLNSPYAMDRASHLSAG